MGVAMGVVIGSDAITELGDWPSANKNSYNVSSI